MSADKQKEDKIMTNSNQPAYHAYSVTNAEQQDAKSTWTRIGAMWLHKNDDGFNLQLECMPLDGRVVLRRPKAKSDENKQ